MDRQMCKNCGEKKPLTLEFYQQGKNKRNGVETLYWYKSCKVCTNKQALVKNRKFKKKNRKKLAEAQKFYHQQNKENDSNTKKVWYQDNKESVLQRIKRNIRKRRKNDPVFRLKEICS